MVAALGLHVCVKGWEGPKLGHWVAAIAGPICLLLIFASTAIWFPYQYAFLNEIGRAFPRGAFDTEVLGLSIHESLFRIRPLG